MPQEYPTNAKDETDNKMISLEAAVDKEVNSVENIDVSDSISTRIEHEKGASQKTVKKPLRRSTRTRKGPSWLKIDAMPRMFTNGDPSVGGALIGDDE